MKVDPKHRPELAESAARLPFIATGGGAGGRARRACCGSAPAQASRARHGAPARPRLPEPLRRRLGAGPRGRGWRGCWAGLYGAPWAPSPLPRPPAPPLGVGVYAGRRAAYGTHALCTGGGGGGSGDADGHPQSHRATWEVVSRPQRNAPTFEKGPLR